MPDTFFRNEKEARFHDIIQPNLYVRVFPNGDVLYSIRVKILIIFRKIHFSLGKDHFFWIKHVSFQTFCSLAGLQELEIFAQSAQNLILNYKKL